ncbi:phage tail protein [Lactiplantibacillus pentosus]|uniref:phage tail protein n=1 Tax=Lactiplantibacillus pentosus TaxID=1589 RepID=UPI0021A94371|nr:phage tail protein [Lactiplantibacillus pentosus]
MAESNATQVILTDDGIRIINAQNTADNAASQAGNADSAALIAQSTANAAKEAADSTYAYANSEIAVQSTATAKAQSTADNAFSQAQAVGSQASAEINNNSTATAKAQSAADNAFSQATTAIDNGKVTSQAVTDLKDGSKLTIAELENGLATKVANSEYASYQTQTASQIASKVDNGAFSAYQTQTADLIAQKVATSDFSAYQATTAKSIDSKVATTDFNTYKTQTATLIADKVSSSQYSSDKTQTAAEIASKVASKDFNTYKTQTDGLIADKVSSSQYSSDKQQTANLIASKVATSDFNTYKTQTASEIASKVASDTYSSKMTQIDSAIQTKVSQADFDNLTISNRNLALETATPITFVGKNIDNQAKVGYQFSSVIPLGTVVTVTFDVSSSTGVGEFVMQFYGSDSGSNWQTIAKDNLVNGTKHVSVTLTTAGTHLHIYPRINFATGNVSFSNFIISESSKEVNWTPAPEDQATQSQITQLSDDVNLRVTKGDLIDEINLQAGNTLISSSGQLTLAADTIYFDTKKPVIIPNANITGTLNGKTINAGSQLNQYGNTSYPLTLSPDGSVTSTSFETIDTEIAALRTVIKDGSVKTNFRGMKQLSTGIYPAADIAMGAGQLALLEGYSTSQDPNFTATGLKTTGYAILDASAGLSLHGTTQAINFSGTDQNQTTGITMNSYGNIIGYPNATWWRIVSNSGSNVANFGIDRGGSNVIQFNRELDIGNFQLNGHHTFTSADRGAIHFAKGGGGANDIYAGTVHYTSLVKSSLLSVKKDVQKADTAYWAQLVNSIDLATYQYKTDDNTSHLRLSSIVDDVNVTKQWQLPDVFISRDEDGKLCGVDDSVLLNATLATVQEQQKEIDQLNGHNMELEARLNKLEAKLNG